MHGRLNDIYRSLFNTNKNIENEYRNLRTKSNRMELWHVEEVNKLKEITKDFVLDFWRLTVDNQQL